MQCSSDATRQRPDMELTQKFGAEFHRWGEGNSAVKAEKQAPGSIWRQTEPAVKAGGMRVSKKQVSDDSGANERRLKKPAPERPSTLMNMQAWSLLPGALQKLSHEFPAEAAYLTHYKPLPTVDKANPQKRLYIIHQPRKF
uniref:Uncharacterized protein n=1 Tax=Leptobrachium leishanense TaxID=445787 RepID=A0A8C5Q7G3_9ANUR